MFAIQQKCNLSDDETEKLLATLETVIKNECLDNLDALAETLCCRLDAEFGKFWYCSISENATVHAVGSSVECNPKYGKFFFGSCSDLKISVAVWKSLEDAIVASSGIASVMGSNDNYDKNKELSAIQYLIQYRANHPQCTYAELATALKEHFDEQFGRKWQCLVGNSLHSSWSVSTDPGDYVLLDQGPLQIVLFRAILPTNKYPPIIVDPPRDSKDKNTPTAPFEQTLVVEVPDSNAAGEVDQQIENLQLVDKIVKQGGGEFRTGVLERTFGYMDYHFKGWIDFASDNIMIPPYFTHRFSGPLDQAASGFVPIKKGTQSVIDGDSAEENVLLKLYQAIAPLMPRPFMLSKAHYNELKLLFPEFLCAKKLSSQPGEITDVILVGPGNLILIEIKNWAAVDDESLLDPIDQLNKASMFFKSFISELTAKFKYSSDDFPVHKCLYLRVRTGSYDKEHVLASLAAENITFIDDEMLSNFPEVLNSLNSKPNPLSSRLLAMLVASINVVSSMLYAKSFKVLDKQLFLKENFRQQQTAIRKDPRSVPENQLIEKPVAFASLYQQFMFLNPEQSLLWNGPRQQYIVGPFGTGKTILLQHRALACAKNNANVFVLVAPRSVKKLYTEFFEQNRISYRHDISALLTEQTSSDQQSVWITCLQDLRIVLRCLESTTTVDAENAIDMVIQKLFSNGQYVNFFMDEITMDGIYGNPGLQPVACIMESIRKYYIIDYCWIVDMNNNYKAYQFQYDRWSAVTDPELVYYKKRLAEVVNKINKRTGFSLELQIMRTVERQTTTLFNHLQQMKLPTHTVGIPIIGHNFSGPPVRQCTEVCLQSTDAFSECFNELFGFILNALKQWCIKDFESLKRSSSTADNDFRVAAVLYHDNITQGKGKKVRKPELVELMKKIAETLKSTEKIPTTDALNAYENAVYFGNTGTCYSWEWPCLISVMLIDETACKGNGAIALTYTRAVLDLVPIEIFIRGTN